MIQTWKPRESDWSVACFSVTFEEIFEEE